MPGYDQATKEMVRKFAANGYAAVCPNLYSREAPGADPDDAAAAVRADGKIPDDRLVGAEDGYPAPDEIAALSAELDRLGKTHEFHTYDGAGHAFFAADRPSYRPEAAVDGWQKIFDFFSRTLSA